jgi:hypothetical protein
MELQSFCAEIFFEETLFFFSCIFHVPSDFFMLKLHDIASNPFLFWGIEWYIYISVCTVTSRGEEVFIENMLT